MKANSRPLILTIETATRAGSLAITRGDTLLVSRQGDASISHSTYLLEQIDSVLSEASITLREIDALAVASGPGSFTGLRIGLATAKSFAATLELPCVGVPTLHAIAGSAGRSACTIALLPAGRGEVFAQKLSVSAAGEVQLLDAPVHIKPESLLDNVSSIRSLKWAGEGAQMYLEAIKSRALLEGIDFCVKSSGEAIEKDVWAVISCQEALAASVGKLAFASFPLDKEATPQDLHAIYVRPSDAELNV